MYNEPAFISAFLSQQTEGYVARPVHIYMRITVRSKGAAKRGFTEVSTGKKVEPEKWSSAANHVTGKVEQV